MTLVFLSTVAFAAGDDDVSALGDRLGGMLGEVVGVLVGVLL